MLTEEEAQNIKEQLFKQIENLPEDRREAIREQIQAMDAEQLEEFLERNKLAKEQGECIFCSIANGETFSYKIAENKEAVAVLDINPVSKGHSLVIPKEHKSVDEIPSALQLAQETAKKIKAKFKADDVKIETTNIQGHGLINIIPIYKDKKLERKKATDEELQNLLKELITEKPVQEEKVEEKLKRKLETSELLKAPRRIP